MVRRFWPDDEPADQAVSAIEHIEALASYAAARNLDAADELLTEMMAILCGLGAPLESAARAKNRKKGMRVLHLLSDPDGMNEHRPQRIKIGVAEQSQGPFPPLRH